MDKRGHNGRHASKETGAEGRFGHPGEAECVVGPAIYIAVRRVMHHGRGSKSVARSIADR